MEMGIQVFNCKPPVPRRGHLKAPCSPKGKLRIDDNKL